MSRYTLIYIGLALLCACSSGKKADDAAVPQDSIPEASEVVLVKALPDTAYSSVEAVKYTVEIVDASIPAELNTLEDLYADTPGGFTFRKGQRRDADFGGRVKGQPDSIVVDWRFTTDCSGKWGGGSGWNGQPVYVQWPDTCINRFRAAGLVKEDFSGREIMVGSLCGKVYFIDFETGKASRPALGTGNPIKGSISLDPTLNGNLYVGEGIPYSRPFGAYVIDLYKHEITHMHPEDRKAPRQWGAYDSSAARAGQFLFRPGENGTLYKFLITPDNLRLQSALRYTVRGQGPGMEASIGIYSNYGYVADNAGNVLCVNLNTMRPVWHYDLGDDVDHSLVVEVEDGHPYVYTGSEIDKQGVNGKARFVKLDGLTGAKVWGLDIDGRRADVGEKHFDGGYYATSLPGRGDCKGLLFANCVLNTRGQNGQFMAINRRTGEIVYTTPLKYYAWSSPVGFLNEQDKMYVFAADCTGNVYLIEGITGKIIYTAHVGNNFESSPVVSGNSLVVGSRGNTIFRMSIK